MAFELPALPYSTTPSPAGMCQETLELHHGKHHQAYVTALNGFVEKMPELQGKSLDEIVRLADGKPEMAAVFNNAGPALESPRFLAEYVTDGGEIPGKLEAS